MTLRLPDSNAAVDAQGRRTAPSATRNLASILKILGRYAPATGRVLELASGTGQQIAQFARAHPGLIWQASDRNADNLVSIRAWGAGVDNLLPPIVLDAAQPGWARPQDLVIMVNLLHLISDRQAEVVLAESSACLTLEGSLLIYGPFLREGRATSEGDASFDASLRAQDPAIGYKDLAWVTGQLAQHGMLATAHEMPANNLMLCARRADGSDQP